MRKNYGGSQGKAAASQATMLAPSPEPLAPAAAAPEPLSTKSEYPDVL